MSRSRALAAIGLLTGSLVAAGCGSTGVQASARKTLLDELEHAGLTRDVAAPMEMTPEMKRWAIERVPFEGSSAGRLDLLLAAILDREKSPFVYTSGATTGIVEAWRTGKANCLTFSHLFVAMSRALGLDTYFLRVRDLASFDREGDLVVSSDHVTAAWGPLAERRILDFTARPIGDYHQVERISDRTALALYYSNLGAERIRSGAAADAGEPLAIAVRVDPELADAWVNLGVARRRGGDFEGAEAAYRRALEADPETAAAYHNLAGLLKAKGRTDEAQALLALADRKTNRNSWSYLSLGDIALDQTRIEEAERLYRRARLLAPENPEPLAALGECALASGRRGEAKRWLRKATGLDPRNPRVAALARKLELESG